MKVLQAVYRVKPDKRNPNAGGAEATCPVEEEQFVDWSRNTVARGVRIRYYRCAINADPDKKKGLLKLCTGCKIRYPRGAAVHPNNYKIFEFWHQHEWRVTDVDTRYTDKGRFCNNCKQQGSLKAMPEGVGATASLLYTTCLGVMFLALLSRTCPHFFSHVCISLQVFKSSGGRIVTLTL